MKFRYAAFLILAGCASVQPISAPQSAPRWLLLASPPSAEYPSGCDATPVAYWSRVGEYASDDGCEESTSQAANVLQLPVQCVASDDPRMKGALPVRLAASDCVGGSCVPANPPLDREFSAH